MTKERLHYIDRLKGLAIVLMVMGHVIMFSCHKTDFSLFPFIGSFHMHLFMFMSGLVVFTPPHFERLSRKLLAFLCPAIVIGLIFSLHSNFISPDGKSSESLTDYLVYGTWSSYWYLRVLAIGYVIVSLLSFSKQKRWWLDISVLLFFYVPMFLGFRYGTEWHFRDIMEHCVCFYPFFAMGFLARRYNIIDRLVNSNWCFTAGLVGYVIFYNVAFPIHGADVLKTRLIVPLCAVLAFIYAFYQREKSNSLLERELERLGKKSLDVYLLHGIFLANLQFDWLGKWFMESGNETLFVAFVATISIPIAYGSVFIGDLIRRSHLLNKIVYGKI